MAQVVWGVFVLSSIRRWTAAQGMPQLKSEVLFWITLACAVYGAVLFHELGHFVLGDIVRFRLIGFGVGPLSWAYSGGRWRVHLRYDKLFGGHTAMVPTTPRNIRGRVMILTLGGPLASAMLGMIGAICLLLIPGPAWPAALGRVVALATGFAFGDLIFNLLPMASEAEYSDGARLWQMYRRGPWCDFHCANHFMGLSQTTALAAARLAHGHGGAGRRVRRAASRTRRIVRDGLHALSGPLRLGARAVVAGPGASGRSPGQQSGAGPHRRSGVPGSFPSQRRPGSPALVRSGSPGGTIRRITGDRPLRSGPCRVT